MPRLTIARLMLAVAGLAVIFAAFRAHFSLGSLVAGLVSVAGVRTGRWLAAERAAGRPAPMGRFLGHFGASMAVAAGSLLVVFVGFVGFSLIVGSLGAHTLTTEAQVFFIVIGSFVGVGLLRLVHWFLRQAIVELPPVREPSAEILAPAPLDDLGRDFPDPNDSARPTSLEPAP